jgi:thiol-disulfide isomerase/thioredoxin
MKPRRVPLLILGLALLGPACGGKGTDGAAGQTIRAATGYNLAMVSPSKRWSPKAWSGATLDGGTLTSAGFDGEITVVNFWASWCGPCRAEQPALEKIYKEYASRGVRFVGVNIRDTQTNARAHLGEFAVTYPSVFNKDATIAFKYRVLFIPTTYVLDRDGRIAARIIGATHEPDLTRVLNEELAA